MKEDDILIMRVDEIKGEEKEPGLIVKLLATGGKCLALFASSRAGDNV